MYNNLLNFKDIHVISKILSLIVCIFSILIVNNPIFLLIFVLLFYFFFSSIKLSIVSFLLLILSFLSPFFLFISKILFLILTFILLVVTIDLPSLRYFIECIFYKQRKSKGTYIALYICYFFKYFGAYIKDFIELSRSYGKKVTWSMFCYMIKESFEKTKGKIDSLMVIYRYRFYNSFNNRTYLEKPDITSIDIKYILIFVILFFAIFMYGR